MTLEELLGQLNGVRRVPTGFVAFCPSHDGRRPKLAIREGERGILLKCWIGCDLENICKALGISQRDLFYDAPDTDRETIRQRQAERQQREARKIGIEYSRGLTTDTRREAENFLAHCRELDPSTLSPEKFESLMNTVCDALVVLVEEETHAHFG